VFSPNEVEQSLGAIYERKIVRDFATDVTETKPPASVCPTAGSF